MVSVPAFVQKNNGESCIHRSDTTRLFIRMVVTKLSQQEHSWTSMGYTQYVILCKHISSHCQKIGEKKAHVEKVSW